MYKLEWFTSVEDLGSFLVKNSNQIKRILNIINDEENILLIYEKSWIKMRFLNNQSIHSRKIKMTNEILK